MSIKFLVITLLFVYLISFCLPAYFDYSGYDCLIICSQKLLSLLKAEITELSLFYYIGFCISNLLFVTFALVLLIKESLPRLAKIFQLIICVHVASWGLLNLSDLSQLKIGYYLWLGAYIGLTHTALIQAGKIQQADHIGKMSPLNISL